jgi:hypothetical protein
MIVKKKNPEALIPDPQEHIKAMIILNLKPQLVVAPPKCAR